MFLNNEVGRIIEKLIIIFDMDLLYIYRLENTGLAIINTAKKLNIPIIYFINDLESLWLIQEPDMIKNQLSLFASKYIFNNIDRIFIKKDEETKFKQLIENNNKIKYSVEEELFQVCDDILKNRDNIKSPEYIKKLLIDDLLNR